ncbi:DegT/DnrJ/EryC1/StrS family aminotransferase [Aestuariimicrobium sp. p3-SID1156]|uniref:DegT/DnrJ/EryC1/StrS family aminotransferase n=1 Tax=Aestuariimicrobium sp. p3-SID1156 TaxID=2916038 RepID=UPI00223B1984|nr:DegT/DnrJ/EryC1/StrS family aminotransferase [Aestuariimicrobium sp. p3-SID1156]MCT1459529.1 DegT/DnrJ/EryC1/StrS family aminotransferase [Aestuariimicrobium sp. p3-SID1156]
MTPPLAIDGAAPLFPLGEGSPWPSWPPPATEEQRALQEEVLRSGRWGATSGELCHTFAQRFAERHGCVSGVTTVNGTVGLSAALAAWGVGPGDEVVVPAYTFVASATAVAMLGATPVIADVDPHDGHLSAQTLQEALSEKTRAVMVVHIAGSPCDMDQILPITRERGLPVLEDAAQAHGASYRGRPAGSLGDAASFSFQSSKAMTAGEGGILTTPDAELGELLWSVCNVGRSRRGAWYGHERIGWNLRMTEFQAAILLPWLDRLDEQITRRNAFVDAFSDGLARRGVPARVAPCPEGTTRDTRHLAMIDLNPDSDPTAADGTTKDWVLQALAAEGVPTDAGYPGLHRIPAIAEVSRCLPAPGTDRFCASTLWLRQNLLMADPEVADQTAEAFSRVLSDPRSRSNHE